MEVPLMFISREAFCSYSTVHMDMREIIIHNYGHPVPNMVSNSKHQTIKTKHKTGRSTKLQDVASTLQKPQVIAINHNIPSTPSVQRLWRYLNKCVPCSRVHISFQVWRIGSGCAYGNTDRQDDKYTHDSCMAFTNNEVNVKGGKKRKKNHKYTGIRQESFRWRSFLCRQWGSRALRRECIDQSWCWTLEARRWSLGETASLLLIQRRNHTQLLMSQNATVIEYMIISRLARSLFSSSKSCSRRFSLIICTDKWEKRVKKNNNI